MFAYPLVARLVAAGQPANVSAVYAPLNALATHIVSHGYRLIDVTGQPTTWGHWEPALINGDRKWSDERGLNALQLLGLLAAALVAAPDPAE